jgi:hypothetical protein
MKHVIVENKDLSLNKLNKMIKTNMLSKILKTGQK